MADIDHNCDGPMTPLVAMYRACELAQGNYYDIDICAEAALEVFEEYGWLMGDMK